ncbi:MAG TPA: hypothetical protein VN643_25335 [Pyrinomonadaceae bacterium]|nr:hypothetical protein [Pyrinomonadaceae bacterium]
MRFRSLALAALILLLGGMSVNSQAQQKIALDSPNRVNSWAEQYQSEVFANEISAGTVERNNVVYGSTFSGNTKGDLSGHLFVSVNYANDINAVGLDKVSTFGADPLVNVSGGSWSKMIYVDGNYAGSLSGSIGSGSVTWNADHTMATVELQLVCENGTESFAGITGFGTFSGTIDRVSGGAVKGVLTLNY